MNTHGIEVILRIDTRSVVLPELLRVRLCLVAAKPPTHARRFGRTATGWESAMHLPDSTQIIHPLQCAMEQTPSSTSPLRHQGRAV